MQITGSIRTGDPNLDIIVHRRIHGSRAPTDFTGNVALEILETILTGSALPWSLLPMLSLCNSVLALNSNGTDFHDFLVRCCERLQHTPSGGHSFLVHYAYVLASLEGDEMMVQRFGHLVVGATDEIANTLGRHHPATISSINFKTWHLMHNSALGVAQVHKLLLENIDHANRAVGPGNLLAINASAILGRLLLEQGLLDESRAQLYATIQQVDDSVLLQPYKAHLTKRLIAVEESIAGAAGRRLRAAM